MSFKNILVPCDFSELFTVVTPVVRDVAGAFGSRATLLHVYRPPTIFIADMTFPPQPERLAADTELAEKKLAEIAEDHFATIEEVELHVTVGEPFVEIIRYARENEHDLIVMSTHGHTGLKHALIGSVAERVVRKAPCAVLTIRPEEHEFELP